MKIATRLNLAVLPSVVGVLLLAALAYWGERGRQAPAAVLLIGLGATIASVALSWWNARFVAARVEHLASFVPDLTRALASAADLGADLRGDHCERAQQRPPLTEVRTAGPPARRALGSTVSARQTDELDQIESTVAGLSSAMERVRAEGDARAARAEAHREEYAALLEQVVGELGARVEEAHLPLHILLESPFGELNENQEELLGAARAAVVSADTELRQLRRLIALDRKHPVPDIRPVTVETLLHSPSAIARARATEKTAGVRTIVPDTLPRVLVDPSFFQEALTMVLLAALEQVPAGGEIVVEGRPRDAAHVVLRLYPAPPRSTASALSSRLAMRLVRLAASDVHEGVDALEIGLPAERSNSDR